MSGYGRDELLILNRTQFGYLLDTYHYCRLAADRLSITYVSFDVGRPKLQLDGVKVRYVAYTGRKLRRFLRLMIAFARAIRKCRGVVFINYFPGCSVLRWLGPRERMIVDVRTGSIHQNARVRRWQNRVMQWECRRFSNISVVSSGLVGRLGLPPLRTHVLPLGAEPTADKGKRFDRLDLLYVGTFDGRRMEETIIGFERFLKGYGARIALTYTIVGTGHHGELERLRKMVQARGLDDAVHLTGYIHQTQLGSLFDHCNVGVSYVPINEMYDLQPVTKTFEYLFAGMPVVATATSEHKKVVGDHNGVLIQDTPESFYHGLEEIYTRRHEFDSHRVRQCAPEASWDRIVNLNLVPYIRRICQSRLS